MRKTSMIIAILMMSIGFASISTSLIINGNSKVNENESDFEIIFTKANLDNVDVYDDVVSSDKQTINFTSNDLINVGDTSILNYEITNNSGNYDAEVVINCGVKAGTSSEYTSITNSLENGDTVIVAGESVNGVLKITLNKTSLNEVIEEYVCSLEFNAVERDTLGVEIPAFTTDSWETIATNIRAGNTDMYNVGDTKKITISEHISDCSGINSSYKCSGSATVSEQEAIVRISNKEECTSETSETACGFVIEFVDVIENYIMNKTLTNVGGWRDSAMRSYLNSTIYESLPSSLQNVIADTKVISGHGSTSGEENFETNDKLYLLSIKEVYGKVKYDTVDSETKQLEYYKNKGATINNYESALKNYNGSAYYWFLRSADSSSTHYFLNVSLDGAWNYNSAYSYFGVSPAFRIV